MGSFGSGGNFVVVLGRPPLEAEEAVSASVGHAKPRLLVLQKATESCSLSALP
jgi:hypothetical protein